MAAKLRTDARKVGDLSVEAGRGPGQLQWYEFATTLFRGKSVLDAGCGLGKGLDILRRGNNLVRGQDLDPRLASESVFVGPLEELEAKSFDVVTCMDVIEHVEDDRNFAAQLCRVAREHVFVSTPNWTITRCQWPYHIREYTPRELVDLFAPYGKVELFKGNSSGRMVFPVRHPALYHLANDLRASWFASIPTRAVNKVLPDRCRILGHNAILVTL